LDYRMFNKPVDIYWTPVMNKDGNDPTWENLAWFEPEPAFKRIASQRDSTFLKCPVVQDYYKNTFVIKSPVDVTITTGVDVHGKKFIQTNRMGQKFYDNFVHFKEEDNKTFYMFTLGYNYLFVTKESCLMEMLVPNMEVGTEDNIDNMRILTGQFDISKWIRPVHFGGEIKDPSKPIVFKRGDPLMYLRFTPHNNKKVNMIRTEFTDDMRKTVESCVALKHFVSNNNMEQNYTMAQATVKFFKDKFFPKKCPFGFKK